MTGREGPGPERPGPDYPPEWDDEPAEDDGELLAANRAAEESEPEPATVWGPPPGPDPWSTPGPVPPPPF